jgi:glycosyltransferase 2 family protein
MGRHLLRLLGAVAVLVGAYLLYRVVQRYDFGAIAAVLTAVAPSSLALPVGLVVVSYLSLTITEYVYVRYAARVRLRFARVARITVGSLGIGHSIGLAALSSGAVRLRMYGRSGIGIEKVARIMLFSAITVSLGFTTLIAMGLIFNHALVVTVLNVDRAYTAALAAALLCVPVFYLMLCFLRRRPLRVGQFSLPLPPPAIAAVQIILGCSNLLLKAAVLTACINLFADTDYTTIASLYVTGDAASVIGHVPGGWGVLEFIVLHQLPGQDAAAGLLVFRVIYYLAPLLLGLLILAGDEIQRRRRGDGRANSHDKSESPRLRYVSNVSHR